MKSTLASLLGLAGAAVAIFAAMKLMDATGGLSFLDAWLKEQGALGMLAYTLAGALSVVFFFPGSILMTTSGAAYGLGWGLVVAQAATFAGAALAFLVSRHLARRRVAQWMSRRPRFAAVDEAVGQEGWKLVVLTRCCPIFPYIFQNYAYGLTQVRFRHYSLGSFVGLLPATAVFVYLGSMGRAGVEAASGAASSLELGLRVVGFAATVAVTLHITRVATRAVQRVGL